MKLINSLKDISKNYELFIIDIFGVIHDGDDAYPNIISMIDYLGKKQKKIVFLSNAPRRSEKAIKALAKFGINENMFDFILTSGEHAYYYFEVQNKLKYFYIGPEKDRDLLEGLPHIEVAQTDDADIAIATGLDPHQQVTDILPKLESVKAAKLTLHCINPDLYVHKKNGHSHICAGAIAQKYQELGGKVEFYGKPFQGVYDEVIDEFEFSKKEILCIGDSLETDIKGANMAGLDSVFISSGMHRNQLNLEIGETPELQQVEKLCQKFGVKPNYILSLFGN